MSLDASLRPDGRWVVPPPRTWTAAAASAAVAIGRRTRAEVLTTIDEDDAVARQRLEAAGFGVARTEAIVEVPPALAIAALSGAELPHGIVSVDATEVDVARLQRLDDEMRGDVPGTDGWRSTVETFRAATFDDPAFDPRTYRVAVTAEDGEPVGILRIWLNRSGPRIGLWGVRRAHRRRGIAAALLREALSAMSRIDGRPAVTEYDVTNAASAALARRIGARELRRTLEMRYPPPA